ncbi:MAG: nitric oxide reductase activation protein [Gammaproteobacteria bacterium]|nr:nitric oxide reductase activation protein [Gammaproteobacteria bacterium]MDH5730147.1 nitric oxide reductase activation protein [Gammaproteobacteria bacterium]
MAESNSPILSKLQQFLEVEYSFLDPEQFVEPLSRLSYPQQQIVLRWTARLASAHVQLAYEFLSRYTENQLNINNEELDSWLHHAMDVYDQEGFFASHRIISDYQAYLHAEQITRYGVRYKQCSSILNHFVHGLSGRELKLDSADALHCDSETIFLPLSVSLSENQQENFLIYKAMIAFHWAQARFGTHAFIYHQNITPSEKNTTALALFESLENYRIDAMLAQHLPGLYRDLSIIQKQIQLIEPSAEFLKLSSRIMNEKLHTGDVYLLAQQFHEQLNIPTGKIHHSQFHYEKIKQITDARIKKEKALFRIQLQKITEDLKRDLNQTQFQTKKQESSNDHNISLQLDELNIPMNTELRSLSRSIIQDMQQIPEDYLVPAGPGEYDPSEYMEEELSVEDVWKGAYHEQGAYLYSEWDFTRELYRKNWCAVRELELKPLHDDFVQKTKQKYHRYSKRLRQIFERLRDENKTLKQQTDGDEVDIDALVETLADVKKGLDMSDRLFTRKHQVERDVAVIFMVDMSGSTKGWINQAERESLLLLAEALCTLGDRFAIYGFSGWARKRCEIYKIKTFEDVYDDAVQARIAAIEAKDFTRMGFAIRHLTQKLNETDAKTRLLITLSDGKPDDIDHYRGQYGIEDTRRALLECKRDGVHPYCITIDEQAADYLPYLYGPAAYSIVQDVTQLPLKVTDIYRKLTT